MQTLRCVVIDDEPLAGQLIGNYARRTPSLQLAGVFTSAREAYSLIISGEVDLLFLDIQMPELSGMEFVKLIPRDTMVIFVTAYENYAIEGIRVNAVDYLLKPVNYTEFIAAVERAMERRRSAPALASPPSADTPADDGHIIVKSEYRHRQIAKRDILFVEGLKDYVRIFVEGQARSVMTLMSMKTLEGALTPPEFMRVHRSYIVNLSKINAIERGRIFVTDNRQSPAVTHEVPVSDSYRPQLLDYIASRTPSGS